ncbi:MAG: sulfotransferase [Candidatus Pacebacteria bacterium]|nr:sulfotransferase [Candidatus Paceibacterota bacterium]
MSGQKEQPTRLPEGAGLLLSREEQERKKLEAQIALTKRRIYRFSDSLADHVLVEELENRFLLGEPISPFTKGAIRLFLEARAKGKPYTIPTEEIAIQEKVDLASELKRRIEYEETHRAVRTPDKVVFIIGSPRSGTSFLYNLLAYQGLFGYFTSASHFHWPLYSLDHSTGKHHFQTAGASFFEFDTKPAKLRKDLILPSEGEDILGRGIRVYDQIRTHQYLLKEAKVLDPNVLRLNALKHTAYFDAPCFLSKSPFNTFRILELAEIFGENCFFLHLHRNGYCAAASIEANGFKYFTPEDDRDNPALFWARHVEEALRLKGEVEMMNLAYEDLVADSSHALRGIFDWLGIPTTVREVACHFREDRRLGVKYERNETIEKYNSLLGYT